MTMTSRAQLFGLMVIPRIYFHTLPLYPCHGSHLAHHLFRIWAIYLKASLSRNFVQCMFDYMYRIYQGFAQKRSKQLYISIERLGQVAEAIWTTGPNIMQICKCVRYYFRLPALLHQVACATLLHCCMCHIFACASMVVYSRQISINFQLLRSYTSSSILTKL